MTRTRSRNNKLINNQLSKSKSKTDICNKCQSSIEIDKYTYKILRTGHTICKNCWVALNDKTYEDGKQQNVMETKSCKVFLKDVLRDSVAKEQQLHKIDENSVEESKIQKAVSDTEIDSKRQGQKRSIRHVQSADTEMTNNSNKRMRPRAKQDNANLKQPTSNTVHSSKRQLRRDTAFYASQNSDSDFVVAKRPLTKQKVTSGASLSDADVGSKRDRRQLRTIWAGNSALKNTGGSDESSNEEVQSKRKRVKLAESLNEPLITIDLTESDKYNEIVSNSRTMPTRKGRSVGRPSLLKTSKKSQSSESDNADSADAEDQLYACKECQANYENKLECLRHQLTHYKQLTLELERAVIGSMGKETVDSQEAVDDQTEAQSETIGIRVDDDEEETVDVNKLDESCGVQAGSDKEENALPEKEVEENALPEKEVKENALPEKEAEEKASSEKDTEEDAADVKLVMKESDDDQSQTDEKAAEETQQNESTEAVVLKTPRRKKRRARSKRSSRRGGKQSRSRSSGKSDESVSEPAEESNANAEEAQDISFTPAEDVEKDKPAEEEDKEERVRVEGEEDKDEENRVEGEDKEKDLRVEGEGKEDEVRTEGEDKEDEVRAEEDEDEVRAEGEDKEDEARAEGEDREEGVRVEEVDEESNKRKVEEQSKDEEVDVTRAGEKDETINLKDVDNIVDEDKIDLTEGDEQHETKNKDAESSDDVDSKADDVVEVTEIEDTESTNNGNGIIQVNGDAKPMVVAEEVTSLKEIDITDEDEPEVIDVNASESNTVEQKEATSDSVTVAAEVLQEVIDLASAEVQNRQEVVDADHENSSAEAETLENISREIQNSVDVSPSKLDSSTAS